MTLLKGRMLVASPRLLDPNFMQTVVLIVQHDEDGALGLVLNRPTELNISRAWEQISESACLREGKLYVGGPCEGVLMVIHPFEEVGQIQILPELWFSTDTQHIEWLVQQTDESRIRFFVGYSGWSPGQLEKEMDSGSWLTADATLDRIFGEEQSLWRRIKTEIAMFAIMGKVNPRLIPADPSMN